MGTNFYARHIPTEEQYEEMKQLLRDREFEKLQDAISEATKRYHIGKRSGGWQFLFASYKNEHEHPWLDSIESISEFISRPDYEIINEYREKFTPEQFWKEEVGDALYHDKDNYVNGYTYYDKHPEEKPYYNIAKVEFTTQEGLRFARDPDFG